MLIDDQNSRNLVFTGVSDELGTTPPLSDYILNHQFSPISHELIRLYINYNTSNLILVLQIKIRSSTQQ